MLREQVKIVKRWAAISDTTSKSQQKGRRQNHINFARPLNKNRKYNLS